MTDGPARPMTGIRGAGFPGTAQVIHFYLKKPGLFYEENEREFFFC